MTAAVLAGLGAWLPPRVVTNDDLSAELDTSDEWITTRTGIRQRHVADAGMSTGTLAVEAAARALKSAAPNGAARAADALVLATTTPDLLCPATAPEVASRLGLTGVPAFDLTAACAGFVYALAIAAGQIGAGLAERVLVIGADTFAAIVDPGDRASRPLFGDGAGAVLLRAGDPDEPGALGPVDLGSDGALAELITVPGGSRQRCGGRPAVGAEQYFSMRGKPVFRHAVERMTESAGRALATAGWSITDVDRFACHQANSRILAALAQRLGLPPDRVLANIAEVGNTSAASIPVLLADSVAAGALCAGDRVLLTAFGAGLAWGATTLRWPSITAH